MNQNTRQLKLELEALLDLEPDSSSFDCFHHVCEKANQSEDNAQIILEILLRALDSDLTQAQNAVRMLDICVKGSQIFREFVHSSFVQSKLMRVVLEPPSLDLSRNLALSIVSWHEMFSSHSLFGTSFERLKSQGILEQIGWQPIDLTVFPEKTAEDSKASQSDPVYISENGAVTLDYLKKTYRDLNCVVQKFLHPARNYLRQHATSQSQQMQVLINTLLAIQQRVTQMLLEGVDEFITEILIQVNYCIISTLNWYKLNNGEYIELQATVLNSTDIVHLEQSLDKWKYKLNNASDTTALLDHKIQDKTALTSIPPSKEFDSNQQKKPESTELNPFEMMTTQNYQLDSHSETAR